MPATFATLTTNPLPGERAPVVRRRRFFARHPVLAGISLVVLAATAFWGYEALSFNHKFRAATTNVDRIRVRSGGICHRQLDHERTLIETADPAQVRRILANTRVVAPIQPLSCRCCGDVTIEAYEHDTLVAALSLHHGKALRWPDHWYGDADLTAGSLEFWRGWFAENGVGWPKE
jgi:hypothetical protein